jgi:hypothetical protein
MMPFGGYAQLLKTSCLEPLPLGNRVSQEGTRMLDFGGTDQSFVRMARDPIRGRREPSRKRVVFGNPEKVKFRDLPLCPSPARSR